MEPKRLKKVSKWLSKILRHHPERIGVELDEGGWADIDDILRASETLTRTEIEQVIALSDKQRFTISGNKIRANYGHSIPIKLDAQAIQPPIVLYHGTSRSSMKGIRKYGLLPMQRKYVHLTESVFVAHKTAQRKGKPLILTVMSDLMHRDGYEFYLVADTWLVKKVPARYIVNCP